MSRTIPLRHASPANRASSPHINRPSNPTPYVGVPPFLRPPPTPPAPFMESVKRRLVWIAEILCLKRLEIHVVSALQVWQWSFGYISNNFSQLGYG